MSRVCGYTKTTTGYPCKNVVEDFHDHCEAGHPCPPVQDVAGKPAIRDLVASPSSMSVAELFVSTLVREPQVIDLREVSGSPREKIGVNSIELIREGRKVTARLAASNRERGKFITEFWFSAPESHPEAKLLRLAIDLANTKHRYGQGPHFIQTEDMEFRLSTTLNASRGPGIQRGQLQLQDST